MNGVLNNAMTNTAQSAGLGKDKSVKTERKPAYLESVRRPQEEPAGRFPHKPAGQGETLPDGSQVRRRTVVRKRVRRKQVSQSQSQRQAATQQAQAEQAPVKTAKARGGSLVWKAMGGEASLRRASLGFEQQQAQNPSRPQVGAKAQQQYMLNRLVRMVSISMEQHTGGRSGESYSRRDTRRILGALTSLSTSSKPKGKQEKTERARHTEASLEAKRSRVLNLLAVFEPEPTPEGYEPVQLVA